MFFETRADVEAEPAAWARLLFLFESSLALKEPSKEFIVNLLYLDESAICFLFRSLFGLTAVTAIYLKLAF